MLRPPSPLQSMMLLGCGRSGGGASFVGPLDAYASGLMVALLPFRGFTAYEGFGIRARDDDDNSEANIDFAANGALDPVVTVGSPWFRTWNNQAGSNDFGNATATQQPGFSASSINAKPAAIFTGGDDFLQSGSSMAFAAGFSLYFVGQFAAGEWQTFWSLFDSTNTRFRKTSDNNLQVTTPAGNAVGTTDIGTSPTLISVVIDGTDKKAWLRGALEIDVAQGGVVSEGAYRVGLDGYDSWPMNGPVSALLVYNAAHDTTTRQAIEAILAEAFNITLT